MRLVEEGEEVVGKAIRRETSGGGMLRRDGCLKFGRKYGLRVCTIEDLVDYVMKDDVKRTLEKDNRSTAKRGDWNVNGGTTA